MLEYSTESKKQCLQSFGVGYLGVVEILFCETVGEYLSWLAEGSVLSSGNESDPEKEVIVNGWCYLYQDKIVIMYPN